MDRDDLEGLDRESLVVRAEALGMRRARILTRPELIDELLRRDPRLDEAELRRSRGFFGRARDLLSRVVERGLHLPDAASRIRWTGPLPPSVPRVESQAMPTLTLAEIYAAQGHKARAIDTLRRVLEREPEHAAARAFLSRLQDANYVPPPPPLPPEPEVEVVAEREAEPESAEAESAEPRAPRAEDEARVGGPLDAEIIAAELAAQLAEIELARAEAELAAVAFAEAESAEAEAELAEAEAELAEAEAAERTEEQLAEAARLGADEADDADEEARAPSEDADELVANALAESELADDELSDDEDAEDEDAEDEDAEDALAVAELAVALAESELADEDEDAEDEDAEDELAADAADVFDGAPISEDDELAVESERTPDSSDLETDACVALPLAQGATYVWWRVSDDTVNALAASDARDFVVRAVLVTPSWDGPTTEVRDIVVDIETGEALLRGLPVGAIVRVAVGWLDEGTFVPTAHSPALEILTPRGGNSELVRWTLEGLVPVRLDDPRAPVARALDGARRAARAARGFVDDADVGHRAD